MPQRKVPLIPGEYYHIYNRGINSEIVFRTERNYYFYLRRIKEIITPHAAKIIAYVLMPTHYHLLVQITNNNFSFAMGRVNNSYTKAYNKDWGRTGPLFEGRFKSKHIDSDKYILELSRYIHRNPVSAHLVDTPQEWPFSSYMNLLGNKDEELPVSDFVHAYFDPKDPSTSYQLYVEDGSNEIKNPIKHLLFE